MGSVGHNLERTSLNEGEYSQRTVTMDPDDTETDKSQSLTFYSASYTKWTDAALRHIQAEHMEDIQIHFGIETHLREGRLLMAQKKFSKLGWACTASP
eukprot:8401152-Pyramimonas_sp.AAC.1